jgi:hypothetical protein
MRYGYQGFGQDPTPAEDQASTLYNYLKGSEEAQQAARGTLAGMDPANRSAVCEAMARQAAADSDTTMPGKVSAACGGPTQAGAATGSGTYMLIGAVALIGLIAWAAHKK